MNGHDRRVLLYLVVGPWRATCHGRVRTHQITRTAPDCLVCPTIHRISRSPRSRLAAPPAPVAAERLDPPDLPVDLLNQRQPAATGRQPDPRSRKPSQPAGRMRANPGRGTLGAPVRRSPRHGPHSVPRPRRMSPLCPSPSPSPGGNAAGVEQGREARTGRTRPRRVSRRIRRTDRLTRRRAGGCWPSMGRCARIASGSSSRR